MIFSSLEQTVPHSKTGLDVETRRLLVFHVYDKVLRKGFKSPNTQYSDLHTEAGNATRCVLLLASAVLQDEVDAETCGGPDPVFVTQKSQPLSNHNATCPTNRRFPLPQFLRICLQFSALLF